jgi:hypothetical protein
MENQTRFDLNADVENWRQELAAQPNLAPDDRRELETHLRDLISEFRRKGLNEEESFRLARKKIGQLRQIGKEFKKNKILTMNKHIIGRCIGYGLATGLAMFLIGLWLAYRADSTVSNLMIKLFLMINAPAIGLNTRWHGDSFDWARIEGLSHLLTAFLIYWTMLGALIGLGLHIWFKSRQNRKTPKRA